MKTTKEMAEIMLAFERGEQIEYRIKDFMRDDEWYDQKEFPEWDWKTFDYRVKPKPKYVPFETAKELFEFAKKYNLEDAKLQFHCGYYCE